MTSLWAHMKEQIISFLVGLVIAVAMGMFVYAVTEAIQDSREESRQRREQHAYVREQIIDCVEDGGTPNYTVTPSGWLVSWFGCAD